MPEPDGSVILWHDTIYGQSADSVPDLIQSTNALVEQFLNKNQDWAQSAIDTANDTLAALVNARFPTDFPNPPALDGTLSAATLTGAMGTSAVPNIGTVTSEGVAPFTPDTVVIPDATVEFPEYTAVITGLSIPAAPNYVPPSIPIEPGLDLTFNVGTAPTQDYGVPPTLTEITIPSYTPAVLPVFNDSAPEFDELPPDPFIPWVEPVYSSDIKDAVKAVLTEMLAGGTGLAPAVEQALWERSRQRVDASTLKLVYSASDQWASRGFAHPPGQLNGQSIAIREEAEGKINELARDIMIKQAELEQSNRQFAVQHGLSYEQIFAGLFMQIVDRNFQIAKFTVETQIQVYNMQIAAFNVQQAVFAQKTERFKVLLESALAPLKEFQVMVEAEKAKAQMNESLVNAYKAKVDAYRSQVEAFKAITEAEVARASMQKLKVDIYKSQIDAMVGQVNLQRGAFEAYVARVQGETAKAGLEESNAKVFAARVAAYATASETRFKEAEVNMANSKLKLEWAVANLNRVSTLNQQQLAVVQANLAGFQASLERAKAEFEAEATLNQLTLQETIETGKLGVGKYTALLEQWKARSAQILAVAQLQSESMRAASQIAATMAAGAMAGTHVSAGMSAGASSNQSRSDNKSESKGFSQSVSDSYSVSHTFPHKET